MALFTSESARAAGAIASEGKGVRPRSQVLALQRAAVKHALAKDTPVGVVASLMRAFVDLQELRMNLEGIGKPKPVDARNAKRGKPSGQATPITSANGT